MIFFFVQLLKTIAFPRQS